MQNKKLVLLLLFFILALAAFLRFWQIANIPPGLYHDEAMNGNDAIEALRTGEFKVFYPENNGREGLFINMQALSVWVFRKEVWALRVVSAFFGTLTVLGIFFLCRELFYETSPQTQKSKVKSQKSKVKSFKFPVSVLRFAFCVLRSVQQITTLPKNELLALLSAFFLATSFWHINFSRIGFRAIMVPFFLVWSFYFLYRLIRAMREEPSDMSNANIGSTTSYSELCRARLATFLPELYAVMGGILFGLGFHTYIAYRLAPLLLIPPFLLALSKNLDVRFPSNLETGHPSGKCSPCLVVLFLFAAFVAALPMGYYFLEHPEDFAGRTSQVSAFAADSPLRVIGGNVIKTIGQFFWTGDYNWRHNLAGAPQLWWPVGILFAIGLLVATKKIIQSSKFKVQNYNPKLKNFKLVTATLHFALCTLNSLGTPFSFLMIWLTVMSLPAVISNEGIPHALRTIGMIPPAMILAAMGLVWITDHVAAWLRNQKTAWPEKAHQINRISWELSILAIVILLMLPVFTAKKYFIDWALHEETQGAFNARHAELGRMLAELPADIPKYVIVNADGVLARGIPMPAQTVMFFAEGGIATRGVPTPKNIIYILPEDEPMLDSLTEPFIAVSLNPK